jgi:CheY-like chemotaxis protein
MTSLEALKQPADRACMSTVANSNGINVLVVEDDEPDAYLIRSVLKKIRGVSDVAFARDGVEALEMIDAGSVDPDIAIIDLNMPRKNGFSFLVELAVRPRPRVWTIVLTSSTAIGDASRSRLRGADYFLTKPDSIEELEFLLSEAIAAI